MPRHYGWEDYFWPNTTVLANKLGIVDEAELRDVEYDQVVDRQGEIGRGEVQIARTFDGAHLRAVHAHLFQDVYEWAGQYRTVDMAKGGRAFLPYRHIEEWMNQSAEQITTTPWGSLDHDQFSDAAANVFANVNYAHGFREGNGRSSRIFMQQCTSDGQFELDFTVIARQPERWNEASRLSVPRYYGGLPDPDPLRDMFREITVAASVREDAAVEDDGGMGAARASFPVPATEAVRSPPELGGSARAQPYRGQDYERGGDYGR